MSAPRPQTATTDESAPARPTGRYASPLRADLEAAVVRALKREWESINWNYFRGALKAPLLFLSGVEGRLGRWVPSERLIEIQRELVMTEPWGVVVEVLKHEAAHQYVHEALGAHGETAHGDAFRRTCERLGIDPSSSGTPRAPVAGDAESEAGRLPRRIAKLLALAESENEHEAELAMREAQRLMLKYNVDESLARAGRRYGFRHLGAPTGRLQPHERQLGALIGRFFFVEAIWVTVHRPAEGIPGTVLEVCGTEANLEMASYVHDFLLGAAERSWEEHKRAHAIRGDRDRRSYLTGVMRGFHDKLEAQESVNVKEGLVWVGDPGLSGFYERRHPRRRTVTTRARAAPEAFAHGKEAGGRLVLHKPVAGHGGASGAAAPRLLGGR